MDKYEYQVCADQIKELAEQGRFAEAMDVADTIDWKRVKSFSMLCTVSEIYKINKDYDESRKILLLAYERYPDRANVIYNLCELDIKLNEIEEAKEFYREFYQLRPRDTNRYVLLYRLYEAMDYSLEEKISLLEEFKRAEYTEKWAYELAVLYHKTGQERKCVETCNEMILWFGDGDYVRKAMELKMKHENLTEEQQRKYEGTEDVYDSSYGKSSYQQDYDGQQGYTGPQEYAQSYVQQQGYSQTQPQDYVQQQQYVQPGYVQQTGYTQPYYGTQEIPQQNGYGQETQGYGQYSYGYSQPNQQMQGYEQSGYGQGYDGYSGIQVQPVSTGKYSTMNLQEELARNMQEVYGRDIEVPEGYYGDPNAMYERPMSEYGSEADLGIDGESSYGPDMQFASGSYGSEEPEETVREMPMPTMSESNISVPTIESISKPVEKIEKEIEELTVPSIETSSTQVDVQESAQNSVPEQVEESAPISEDGPVKKDPEIQPIPQVPHSTVGKEFDKVLSQEYDGQISMSIPDTDMEVKQITGQIDISDFLKEWEEKKKNAQQHLREETRRKQIEQTNDIMSQLVGVIPGIEIPAMSGDMPADTEAPRKEEVVRADDQGSLTKTILKAPSYGREPVAKLTETGTVINGGPVKSEITGAIPDILPPSEPIEKVEPEETKESKEAIISKQDKPIVIPDYILNQNSEDVSEDEDMEKEPVESSTEEQPAYEIEIPNEEDPEEKETDGVEEATDVPETVSYKDETEKPSERKILADNSVPELIPGLIPGLIPDFVGFTIPTKDNEKESLENDSDSAIDKAVENGDDEDYSDKENEPSSENEASESDEDIIEDTKYENDTELTEPDQEYVIPDSDTAEELESEEIVIETPDDQEIIPEDTEKEQEAVDVTVNEEAENPVEFPFDITSELEPVEELVDVEQSEEIDDLLKTGAIPLFDMEKESYESGIEPEEEEEKKPSLPSYMQLEERKEARRDLDPEESRIFGRFEGIESLKAQIVDVIDDMSMDPYIGNVIVMGSELYGRKSLAIDIVKAIQAFDSAFSGKVAKISGEALNKKDIPMTLHKLKNGALIVENAGGLTPITVNTMIEILTGNADPILVVLEDSKEAMEPLITGCEELKSVFNARIEMENFSDADLVAYAKGYAREQEYSIDDETGVLELYTRIHEMQSSIDDVVTVDDIKEIVDNAIRHVDRKNVSHFMDVLVGKRYDEDDFIVLRAKDFQY